MNSPCVFIKRRGLVPVYNEPFEFESEIPKRVGDEAYISTDSEYSIKVVLMRSYGTVNNSTYLVRI